MSSTKIKLDKSLIERAAEYATSAGYSSVEEFVAHCIEKEIARRDQPDSEEEIQNKLKGLGYV